MITMNIEHEAWTILIKKCWLTRIGKAQGKTRDDGQIERQNADRRWAKREVKCHE